MPGKNGSGLEKGGLLVFGMAPVLFPLPRPTVVALCIKALLIDELKITRALLIGGDNSSGIVHLFFKVGQANIESKYSKH